MMRLFRSINWRALAARASTRSTTSTGSSSPAKNGVNAVTLSSSGDEAANKPGNSAREIGNTR